MVLFDVMASASEDVEVSDQPATESPEGEVVIPTVEPSIKKSTSSDQGDISLATFS